MVTLDDLKGEVSAAQLDALRAIETRVAAAEKALTDKSASPAKRQSVKEASGKVEAPAMAETPPMEPSKAEKIATPSAPEPATAEAAKAQPSSGKKKKGGCTVS